MSDYPRANPDPDIERGDEPGEVCEYDGCENERTCFHYCHEHHVLVCKEGAPMSDEDPICECGHTASHHHNISGCDLYGREHCLCPHSEVGVYRSRLAAAEESKALLGVQWQRKWQADSDTYSRLLAAETQRADEAVELLRGLGEFGSKLAEFDDGDRVAIPLPVSLYRWAAALAPSAQPGETKPTCNLCGSDILPCYCASQFDE